MLGTCSLYLWTFIGQGEGLTYGKKRLLVISVDSVVTEDLAVLGNFRNTSMRY